MAHGSTINRTEMAKIFKHQLDIEVGDIVELTAISTTDEWHNLRHNLLYQEFLVRKTPKPATPFDGYNYANWMQLEANVVGKIRNSSIIPKNKMFNFERCQFRIKSKKQSIFPAIMTKREKMLDRINAELNRTEPVIENIPGIPTDNRDKKAWQRLFKRGFHIQARRVEDPKWYKAGNATFKIRAERIFRLKPTEEDLPF